MNEQGRVVDDRVMDSGRVLEGGGEVMTGCWGDA